MNHRDEQILIKITKEIEIAEQLMSGISLEEFEKSEILKRAVCMTVINIGELVKSITDEIRNEFKYIPWKSIAGFRDIAAHKYQTLKMSDVYYTVVNDFPSLSIQLKQILKMDI